MAVYVDALLDRGWVLYGHPVLSCHLFTDTLDLSDLHAMAQLIGMERRWFQRARSAPHYDLVRSRRDMAVRHGAIELDRAASVRVWQARRDLVARAASGAGDHPRLPIDDASAPGHGQRMLL
ncbi:MAG: DUF4031 domain-containing protein [Burkholderiales bacterium]|nr:MAG: DUF4031 domain-containing protein [Burkholderiales bacterium]